MGSSPKTPAPPDYQALAAQDSYNQQVMLQRQTVTNRPTQQNTYGTLRWSQDPKTGEWTQTEQMSPQMQALWNQAYGQQSGLGTLYNWQQQDVANVMNRPDSFQGRAYSGKIDAGKYAPMNLNMGQYISQYDPNSDKFSQDFTKSLLARVTPQQEVDKKAMESQLRLQGLQPGTEAYNRAYQNLLTSQGDVRAQAQLQGMLAGGEEGRARSGESRAIYDTQLQSALQRGEYGMEAYKTMFDAEKARDEANRQGNAQAWQQMMQQYMLPYEIADRQSQMIGGAQGYNLNEFRPSFQNYTAAGQGTAANMMDAAQQSYATQVQRSNEAYAQKQARNSTYGATAGAIVGAFFGSPQAGAAIGGAVGSAFSDMDLKEDIEVISDEDAYNAMLKIYPHSFTWPSGKRAAGLVAQEVLEVFPHLVSRGPQGYLMVDYEAFTALLLGAFRHLSQEKSKCPASPPM